MTGVDLALQELSSLLWRERQVLDRLEYQLTIEQLLLQAGHVGWLARASDEVDAVLDDLRDAERSRAMASAGAAHHLSLPARSPLRALAGGTAEPWPGIFLAHRRALCAQLAGVCRQAGALRGALACGGLQGGRDRTATDPRGLAAYGCDDGPLGLVAHEVAARGALAVTAEVAQPALAVFLA